jgi:GTPase Era involved in 16S rRNA processing
LRWARYYPEDQITDVDLRYMTAEIIREKALYLLGRNSTQPGRRVDDLSSATSNSLHLRHSLHQT